MIAAAPPPDSRNTEPLLSGLDALRTGAGWCLAKDTGWIAVTGPDRVRWLNGMVTNSVQALTPGEGAYTFLLNAQGHIQGDGTVWCEAERLLIQTDASQVTGMMALLDRFIIMDDVELQDITPEWQGIALAGPGAAKALRQLGLPAKENRLLKRTSANWQSGEVFLITAYSPEVPRFELWSRDTHIVEAIGESFLAQGAIPCFSDSFETLRILEARPRFGQDLRERDLPQETAQTRALHFNKGCYLGQEIVERIRSRGRVHRTFVAFRLSGEAPVPGTELQAEGKPVGVLTSTSPEAVDGATLALGYIRQEALERGLPLTYAGGSAEALAARGASNSKTDR